MSLRQEIQVPHKGRAGSGSPVVCGPGSPCAIRVEEMEKEHRERLQEMERAHERKMREMDTQREQMLREEAHHAAQGDYCLHKEYMI